MNSERYNVSTLGQFVGQELGVSDWLTVDQERINEFADCTGDHQWIHVDVERAQRESPLGSTITHGYLTLSLLAAMQMELGIVPAAPGRAYQASWWICASLMTRCRTYPTMASQAAKSLCALPG